MKNWTRTSALMAAATTAAVCVLAQVTPALASGVSFAEVWGSNANGQLGLGSTTDQTTPADLTALTNVTSISAGSTHTLAVHADGTAWAWGDNSFGDLGNGTTANSTVPVEVSGLTNVVQVAASGQTDSLALRSDGTVWAWGDNTMGLLGNETEADSSTPVQVGGLSHIVQIAIGSGQAVALRSDGTVWTWGDYLVGTGGGATPVQVPGITNADQVAAGYAFDAALLSDGTIEEWGYNDTGQLGNGTTTDSATPVQVVTALGAPLTGVTQISAGWDHMLALLSDGTVDAWGFNRDGELGSGDFSNLWWPNQVAGINGASYIQAGALHSMALLADGTVRAWGGNAAGELGDGTTTNRNSPVTVTGLSGVTGLAAGYQDSFAIEGPPAVARSAAISGSAAVGATLTCSATFITATSVSYAWMRDGAAIAGAAASDYFPVTADESHQLTCSVTATNSGGSTTSTSAPVTVPGPPTVVQAASITGRAIVGHVLTCSATFSGSLKETYAWRRGGTAIAGASHKTYVPVAADTGHTLKCTATGANSAGTVATTSPAVTVTLAPHFVPPAPPKGAIHQPFSYHFIARGYPAPRITRIAGSLPPGLTLAANGTLSGTPIKIGTYTFTLKAANSAGSTTVTATITINR